MKFGKKKNFAHEIWLKKKKKKRFISATDISAIFQT